MALFLQATPAPPLEKEREAAAVWRENAHDGSMGACWKPNIAFNNLLRFVMLQCALGNFCMPSCRQTALTFLT